MRVVVVLAVILVSACAADRLSLAPPAGVDFSGRWKLNEADSDDPLRLVQSQNSGSASSPNQTAPGGSGGSGGRGGRGRAYTVGGLWWWRD